MFEKRKLTKAYNENVGGMVKGLIELTQARGSKFQFNIVSGASPFTGRGQVFITTNLQNQYGPGEMAIIVSGLGIYTYGYQGGERISPFGWFKAPEQMLAGEKDAATVKDILATLENTARKQGLLPQP